MYLGSLQALALVSLLAFEGSSTLPTAVVVGLSTKSNSGHTAWGEIPVLQLLTPALKLGGIQAFKEQMVLL